MVASWWKKHPTLFQLLVVSGEQVEVGHGLLLVLDVLFLLLLGINVCNGFVLTRMCLNKFRGEPGG